MSVNLQSHFRNECLLNPSKLGLEVHTSQLPPRLDTSWPLQEEDAPPSSV